MIIIFKGLRFLIQSNNAGSLVILHLQLEELPIILMSNVWLNMNDILIRQLICYYFINEKFQLCKFLQTLIVIKYK